jgi:tetratricopeptide (TPR) repeat protein
MRSSLRASRRRRRWDCGPAISSSGSAGLENDHDNLRAALDSSAANGDDETALRLGGALGWFWYAHGHALEGCARLIDLLARTENTPEELRARPMYALGVLLDQRGEPERAAELVERSLAVFRAHGEQESVARALNSLGGIKRALGELESARSLLEESIGVRRELGDEPGTAWALSNLGSVAFEQGDLDGAEARFTETLALDHAHGNAWGAAVAGDGLAAVALERCDYARAGELIRDTLVSAERLADQEIIAFSLEKAGVLAAAEGMSSGPAGSREPPMGCGNQPASSAAASTASGSSAI